MALVESAGAPWIGSTASNTNVQAAASFTPAANALIVAIIGVGNGSGVTTTSITPTDTFGGTATGAWVQLVAIQGNAGSSSGGAAVWVKDAGSAPTAGVVTATALPSTCFDIGLCVRQFQGARPAASQTAGVHNSATGTISTVSITPGTTGSQVVGAFGIDGGTLRTANAATVFYGSNVGNDGSDQGGFEATVLSTAGTPLVLGYTVSIAGSSLAVAEILPLAAAAGIVHAAPGVTWLRRFHHPQALPQVPSQPPAAPPPLTWLSQPIRAPLPIPRRPRRGHGGKMAAPWSGVGPPLTPPSHPVQARRQQQPRAGRVVSTTGPWSGQGPPLVPLHRPVAAAQRILPRGGRIATARTGTWSGYGPPVAPQQHPVRAARQQQPRAGRVQSQAGVFTSTAPLTGPPVYPLQQPVRARLPLARHGRCASQPGAFSGTGPPVVPLHQPVRDPLPPTRPRLRGRAAGNAGTFSGQGPAVVPPSHPGRSHPQQPRRGRAQWQQGVWASSAVSTSGPPLYPWQHPVQARALPARGGRCASRRGAYSGTGPPVRPLCQPVRDPLPPTLPLRRGHGGKMAGPWSGQGPAFPAPHQPVRAKARKLPLRGRSAGFVTQSPFVPPPAFSVGVLTAADRRTGGPD